MIFQFFLIVTLQMYGKVFILQRKSGKKHIKAAKGRFDVVTNQCNLKKREITFTFIKCHLS